MAFTSSKNSLTKENILSKLDSYQLFKTYCKNFDVIGRKFKSEFRSDSEPSCHVIMWNEDLLYKDFGDKSYRVFDYIAMKYNTDFQGALQIINRDFNLGFGSTSTAEKIGGSLDIVETLDFISKTKKQPTILEITPRKWTDEDKAYWSQYDIPLRLLEYHNISSIAGYKITNSKQDGVYYRTGPYQIAYSFDYYWFEEVFRRKLYFPQTKGKYRFVSNVNYTIVQGWTLLPKIETDILFVTKSYKDILIFNLLGYWAIAPNSEHSFIPEKVMDKLKLRFRNIFTWFDNDEGGIKGGKHFANTFNLPFTHNPIGQPKDPSDYVKEYNLSAFDKLVTQFLKDEGH